MKPKALLRKFELTRIRLNTKFVQMDLALTDHDREAAWDLYVEMLTRITTQPLPTEDGSEPQALASVYSLFPTTREILRSRGRKTIEFTKLAVPVLNQVVRPFTAKWHRRSRNGAFCDPALCIEFRRDLELLQCDLRKYNRLLAHIADVEDLTDLEPTDRPQHENQHD